MVIITYNYILDMDMQLQPGTYVVAVSGGIDSMVLLSMLAQRPDVKLIVAHLDHGIRHDSKLDRQLVALEAKKHNLPFVYQEAQLGPDASEDHARKIRYEFLHQVKDASGAQGIITAHHKDDATETAVINLMRGTGRKGISALYGSGNIIRPLLMHSKQAIKDYADSQGITWREDSTNSSNKYMRNYVRNVVLAGATDEQKVQLHEYVLTFKELNHAIEQELTNILHMQPANHTLLRQSFNAVPFAVAKELMAAWLRRNGIRGFDARTIERLTAGAKTHPAGRVMDINKTHQLQISKQYLALKQLVR